MTDTPTFDAYPGLLAKVGRRVRDLPWQIAQVADTLLSSEFGRLSRIVRPYTMLSNARLRGLYRALRFVERGGIPGDVVECGTARGGSAALMGLALKRWGARRRLWVFDTFAGLPPPTRGDPDYDIAKAYEGKCLGTIEEVEDLFHRLDIRSRTTLVPGLFQETLRPAGVGRIAVLHLDGDWYESVKVCLEELYDRVTPGGVIQIDDFGHWAGARKAWEEFAGTRALGDRLRYIDYTGRQYIKPRPVRADA